MNRSILAGALMAALTACTPRTPPPAPAPAPPPPPPVATEAEATTQARAAWERARRAGRDGRWTDAETLLREAVRLRPEDPLYHLALASALIQLGRHSPAADALLTAIRLEEGGSAPNYRVLIVDYDRLIELLERVNRLDEARTARIRQEELRRRRDGD